MQRRSWRGSHRREFWGADEPTADDDVAHGHRHGGPPPTLHPLAARVLWPLTAACAVVTVIAVVLMWPNGDAGFDDPMLLRGDPVSAKVTWVEEGACSYDATVDCKLIGFELLGGEHAGEFGTMEHGESSSIAMGDAIKLDVFETDSGELYFNFYDFERGGAMTWLLVLFVAAVLLLGRWRGLGALAGLLFSLAVVVVFTLPAILAGQGAVGVAVVTASLIAFAALFLAHGFAIATTIALLSTLLSLMLTVVLASVFVGAAKLTGFTDDATFLLSALGGGIDPRGILLAGIVIGVLGVLDDVTVTQVSAVWELKRVRPELSTRALVTPAMRIGRDHISSTVNTLFLAYVGAALPLLLLFTQAQQGFVLVLTREIVATEVVRALVGSIGLVASVPIATWMAAFVVSGPPGTEADPATRRITDVRGQSPNVPYSPGT